MITDVGNKHSGTWVARFANEAVCRHSCKIFGGAEVDSGNYMSFTENLRGHGSDRALRAARYRAELGAATRDDKDYAELWLHRDALRDWTRRAANVRKRCQWTKEKCLWQARVLSKDDPARPVHQLSTLRRSFVTAGGASQVRAISARCPSIPFAVPSGNPLAVAIRA